ncbi:MAG TPA: nitrous oxide reductase accessory protein NosL [Alphaproteobacteria bacterium]|nr:nitrous oxide reductase accessory protein NosL [Alphaproteobacteria bacterium]
MRRSRPTILVTMLAFAGAALVLAGCGEAEIAAAPDPAKLTRDATGHYCRMIVADHKGPKGQIHLVGRRTPVWFSSVRDAIAFTMLPEEVKRIAAIYVNDMTSTPWERPGPESWIDAKKAVYVIGSKKHGGMGAAEAVPFKGAEAAMVFAAKFGGHVVAFDKIPRNYILGEAGTAPSYGARDGGGDGAGAGHGKGASHKPHAAAPKAANADKKPTMPMTSGEAHHSNGGKDHGNH